MTEPEYSFTEASGPFYHTILTAFIQSGCKDSVGVSVLCDN